MPIKYELFSGFCIVVIREKNVVGRIKKVDRMFACFESSRYFCIDNILL